MGHTVPTVAGGPVYANGGVVTVAVPYLPENFNPSTPAGDNQVTQMVMTQVWPQAFVVDSQGFPETTGFVDQAEVVGLAPMRVLYEIDPGAVWSDGVPITAADFVYNWHEQVHLGASLPFAGPVTGYRDIKSITPGTGGKSLTVSFKRPYSDWESLFCNLVPAHIARRAGWVAAFEGLKPRDLVSGGPFLLSSLVPGKQLVLVRNPRYWGAPAHVAKIVLQVEPTDASTIAGLESGRIGVAEVAPGSQVDSAVAVAAQHNTAISSSTTETSVLWQLLFNLNDSLAGQLGLRQALTFATDRPEIVADSVAFGDPATLAARSRIFADGQQGSFAEAPPVVTYDPTRAASLFATSGYVAGPDGLLRFGGVGRPLSLTIVGPSGNPTILAAELQLQAEWAAAGVTLAITNEPMAELLGTTLPQGRYQIAIAPYLIQAFPTASATVYTDPVLGAPQGGTGPTDSLASRPKWPWSVSTPPGTEPGAAATGLVTRDVVGEQSAQIGSRYEEVLAELNTDQAAAILAKLDTFLWHELATVPLFQQPVAIVQQADLVNVSDSPTWDGVFWDAENWAIQLNPRGG